MVIVETKYLAAWELSGLTDTSFTIAAGARYEEVRQADGKLKQVLVVPVRLSNGKVKDWIPNETTKKKLLSKYGNDTDKWVGKKETFIVMKQNVRGELKDVLYLA